MNVQQAREALQNIQSGLLRIAGESMLEHSQEITGLLVKQQTVDFENSSGGALKTVIRKYVFDFSSSATPFRLPGTSPTVAASEFHLIIKGDEYEIESPSITTGGFEKSTWLTKWNEAPIMDLTPANAKLIYPIIQETFEAKVNEELAYD